MTKEEIEDNDELWDSLHEYYTKDYNHLEETFIFDDCNNEEYEEF